MFNRRFSQQSTLLPTNSRIASCKSYTHFFSHSFGLLESRALSLEMKQHDSDKNNTAFPPYKHIVTAALFLVYDLGFARSENGYKSSRLPFSQPTGRKGRNTYKKNILKDNEAFTHSELFSSCSLLRRGFFVTFSWRILISRGMRRLHATRENKLFLTKHRLKKNA